MGRPKNLSAGARRLNFWLEPGEVETLEAYAAAKGAGTKAEGLRILLRQTKAWLERGAPAAGGAGERPKRPIERDKPSWEWTGTWCPCCGERQFIWSDRGEPTCDNDHGGEQPVEVEPLRPGLRWHHGEWLDPDDPDEAAILEGAEMARKTDETTVEDVEGYQEDDDLADDHYDDPDAEWDGC